MVPNSSLQAADEVGAHILRLLLAPLVEVELPRAAFATAEKLDPAKFVGWDAEPAGGGVEKPNTDAPATIDKGICRVSQPAAIVAFTLRRRVDRRIVAARSLRIPHIYCAVDMADFSNI